MKKTEHYQLNQWELSDRIMMEDFNADNEKIDAALKENKTAFETAVALLGNCKVEKGTYVGTGTYNKDSTAPKIKLPAHPILILVCAPGTFASIVNTSAGFAFFGSNSIRDLGCYYAEDGTFYWLSSGSAQAQLNSSGVTYTYYAFYML